tara:strand:- start:447 stop:698 length:252 start_codon:yes stop_codon:yes gene_type:complete
MRLVPYTFFVLSGASAGVGVLCAGLSFFYVTGFEIDGAVNQGIVYGAIGIACLFSAPLWFALGRILHTLDVIQKNTGKSAAAL